MQWSAFVRGSLRGSLVARREATVSEPVKSMPQHNRLEGCGAALCTDMGAACAQRSTSDVPDQP
jgi:hypothetical protein